MAALAQNKLLAWFRLACVAAAVAALLYVFSRIHLDELARALRSARVGWLLGSVAVYGVVFAPSAWRWHLALRLTGGAVSFAVALRMTLIGHFFYTLFFGVAGGDFAKSALYARWYRLPLPEILAAAPWDRLLGLGGLVVFMGLSFGLAAMSGAFAQLTPTSLRFSPGWLALILFLAALAWLGLRRWGQGFAVGRVWRAFVAGGKRLLSSWPTVWQGFVCSLFVQAGLAASLAFGLQAVSHSPLPWGHLIWIFPVISVASALPVNIAGVGLREGAVLGLLGLYGVSGADAVAASLLTLVARLVWAAVGGLVLLREQRRLSPR